MKKTYINPTMEIVKLANQTQLMAGSLTKSSSEVTDESNVLTHDDEFEW